MKYMKWTFDLLVLSLLHCTKPTHIDRLLINPSSDQLFILFLTRKMWTNERKIKFNQPNKMIALIKIWWTEGIIMLNNIQVIDFCTALPCSKYPSLNLLIVMHIINLTAQSPQLANKRIYIYGKRDDFTVDFFQQTTTLNLHCIRYSALIKDLERYLVGASCDINRF